MLDCHLLQVMSNLYFFPQKLPNSVDQSKYENNKMHIKSTLTLPAVSMHESGNITCMATNEAGDNSSTTRLLVVGKRRDQVK